MKKVLLISLALIAGCKTTNTVELTRTVLITPPEALMNCPRFAKRPNPETATNRQIAEFIVQLKKERDTCGINVDAMKKYVDEAASKLKDKK